MPMLSTPSRAPQVVAPKRVARRRKTSPQGVARHREASRGVVMPHKTLQGLAGPRRASCQMHDN
eukprot:15450622-Alexandrium_andersonii.AAC.1